MNKILLVDDDQYKTSEIVSFLENTRPEYNIIIQTSINRGLRRLRIEQFDLVLLDMSLPTFNINDTENFKSFGGLDFLDEMKRKQIKTPTIIVTQYEVFGEGDSVKSSAQISEECKIKYENYKDIIIFSSSENSWREKLLYLTGELLK